MHTVTVTHLGAGGLEVRLSHLVGQDTEAGVPAEDHSPIAPEVKELAWGGGAFVVFVLLMRLVLFPRLKQGMQARYGKIRSDHEMAEATRAAALAEVADYQAQLASVKAEAAAKVDAARRTLESERTARIAEVNAGIATRRNAAMAEVEAAKVAARDTVASAVRDVASRATELAVGKRPSAASVDGIVADVMGAVSR